jgi:integrase
MTMVKAVRRHLGVKMTSHQFRHVVAKILLDDNPGAYELVRQLMGHKNLKTTTTFYTGLDTKRAGRAHAELVMKLRESRLGALRRRRARRPQENDSDAEK